MGELDEMAAAKRRGTRTDAKATSTLHPLTPRPHATKPPERLDCGAPRSPAPGLYGCDAAVLVVPRPGTRSGGTPQVHTNLRFSQA